MDQSNETRIAVAESRLDAHAQLLENNQEVTARLVDKLDKHITHSTIRDERIQENLSKVTVAVTELSSTVAEATATIKEIIPTVRSNNITLLHWDTAKRTIITIATVISVVVGGVWAGATYLFDNRAAITEAVGK